MPLLPLPEGFVELNFDGSAMGNPGPTGMGGLIHNCDGHINLLCYPSQGTLVLVISTCWS